MNQNTEEPLDFSVGSPAFIEAIENPPKGTTLFDTLPNWVKEKLEAGPDSNSSHLKCGFCGSEESKQALKICAKCQLQQSRNPVHYCVGRPL
jgi:ribosomal protein L37E